MTNDRVFAMSFASVYPHYVAKSEKKGRATEGVDEIIRWLTGYTKAGLANQTFEDEYISLLNLHSVDSDERYLFD